MDVAMGQEEASDSDDSEPGLSRKHKYFHNSKYTRQTVRALEAEGWYRRKGGKGHSLWALLMFQIADETSVGHEKEGK